MKKNYYYSLPLFGNTFVAHCNALGELKAKFQIWAKNNYKITDEESYALLKAGYAFDSPEDLIKTAEQAYKKLPNQEGVINLTEIV